MKDRIRLAGPALAAVLGWALLCTLSVVGAAGPPQDQAAAPFRNEDVVRMLVAGRPTAEIIAAINTAEVSFDLSDEQVEELRMAGVPAAVLSAMRARQAEADRAREPAAPPEAASPSPAPGRSRVTVTIRQGGKLGGAEGIVFPERLDETLARALSAGASAEERTVTDLAVFLACRTADHVPDQWRSKSPLGRDFISVARHEILDFRPGSSRVPAKKRDAPRGGPGEGEPEALLLALPVELAGEIETGVAHDLVVGVAIQVAGRFLQVAEARSDGLVPDAGGISLVAVLTERRGPKARELALEIEREPANSAAPR